MLRKTNNIRSDRTLLVTQWSLHPQMANGKTLQKG